jgi:hypothetical protein
MKPCREHLLEALRPRRRRATADAGVEVVISRAEETVSYHCDGTSALVLGNRARGRGVPLRAGPGTEGTTQKGIKLLSRWLQNHGELIVALCGPS